MKKIDREDILLIIASVITLTGFICCLAFGFTMFAGKEKWDDFYLILTVSVGVLFIFSFLSLATKKYKQHKEEK